MGCFIDASSAEDLVSQALVDMLPDEAKSFFADVRKRVAEIIAIRQTAYAVQTSPRDTHELSSWAVLEPIQRVEEDIQTQSLYAELRLLGGLIVWCRGIVETKRENLTAKSSARALYYHLQERACLTLSKIGIDCLVGDVRYIEVQTGFSWWEIQLYNRSKPNLVVKALVYRAFDQ